jgi:hypothetical protein
VNEKTLDLIRDAAAKVGIEAARLWPQMVVLHWVESIVAVVTMIFFATLASVGLRWAWRHLDDYEDGAHLVMGASLVVLLMLSFTFFLDGPRLVATLFAPEAALALKLVRK